MHTSASILLNYGLYYNIIGALVAKIAILLVNQLQTANININRYIYYNLLQTIVNIKIH